MLLLPLAAQSQNPKTMDASYQTLLDKQAVVETVNAVGTTADRRDWAACQALFANSVTVDYQSLSGQPAAAVTPEQLMSGWQTVLPGFTGTQHQTTNHEIRFTGSNSAECRSYVLALHHLAGASGGETWTVAGRYLHRLERTSNGWKVNYLKLELLYQDGNRQLPVLAGEKVKAGNR